MIKKSFISIVSCTFMFVLVSCKHHEGEYHSLTDKIEAESKDYRGVNVSSEPYIGDIKTIQIKEGVHSFLIPERKSDITSYPCTACHKEPVKALEEEAKKAHWDIVINHANEQVMNCATCHNYSNMDNLKSVTGNAIDFNKSYQLCAQCHTQQFEDWKGGAHGKNIGGWAKPRAAMTCVNCHNPHQPKIESRWPSRFNTQKVKERE